MQVQDQEMGVHLHPPEHPLDPNKDPPLDKDYPCREAPEKPCHLYLKGEQVLDWIS